MGFDFSPEERAFRRELCAFITRELSEDVRRVHRDPDEQGGWTPEFTRRFRQKLGAAGYISMSWPAEHGGGGKGALYQVILGAELEYHRAPDRGSNKYVAPALIAYGTEDQQRCFLPLLRRGEVSFFLGYSEPLCEVRCEGVTVPAAAVVGESGHGWPLVERLLRRGACLKAAELVGIGQAALDMTVAYARDRVQFGRPIGAFQAVHHHCVDMYRDLVGGRLLAYQAASALSEGGDAQQEVAIAKAKASEAVPGITRMAHQVHGGVAYYTDYPLGLYTDRALAAASAYGDAAFYRRQLGRLLREDLLRIRRDQGVAFSAGHLQPGWQT